jgi:hypothetical protein
MKKTKVEGKTRRKRRQGVDDQKIKRREPQEEDSVRSPDLEFIRPSSPTKPMKLLEANFY